MGHRLARHPGVQAIIVDDLMVRVLGVFGVESSGTFPCMESCCVDRRGGTSDASEETDFCPFLRGCWSLRLCLVYVLRRCGLWRSGDQGPYTVYVHPGESRSVGLVVVLCVGGSVVWLELFLTWVLVHRNLRGCVTDGSQGF